MTINHRTPGAPQVRLTAEERTTPGKARYTQSIAVTSDEQATIRLAAARAGLSVSSWVYGRIMSAMSSKAALAGLRVDLAAMHRRGVANKDRTARTSVMLPGTDHLGLGQVAARFETTPHALSQCIAVMDAERAVGGQQTAVAADVRLAATVGVAPVPGLPSLPSDVADMLRALDAQCWPARVATDRDPRDADTYATALAARAKVRAGMVKLMDHVRREEPSIGLVASVLLDHPTIRDVSAMLCLPLDVVARGVALRCSLNAAKAAASQAVMAPLPPVTALAPLPFDLDALVRDAIGEDNFQPLAFLLADAERLRRDV